MIYDHPNTHWRSCFVFFNRYSYRLFQSDGTCFTVPSARSSYELPQPRLGSRYLWSLLQGLLAIPHLPRHRVV